jgi:hypothetical protein
MAHDLKRYWFVAAVFREPGDLVSTVAQLRASNFRGDRVLVLANHRTAEARKILQACAAGPVPVIDVHANDAAPPELPIELSTLLKAMAADGRGDGAGGDRSQVYAQLRQDIAEGALVLIASAADPDAQLVGARILLRANSECVLTHEIAAAGA